VKAGRTEAATITAPFAVVVGSDAFTLMLVD